MKALVLDESINLGGHRFSVNDLAQISGAVQQLAQAYGQSFGQEDLGGRILAGVQRTETATQVSYTGGWMIKGGVIWKVNPLAAENITSGKVIYFVFKTINTYPQVGYQSGGAYQVHIERQVDIVYQNVIPSGVIHVDYTAPLYVREDRIEDLIARVALNTSHRNEVTAAWTELTGTQISFLVQGGTIIDQTSRMRYKIIGKTLMLQVSIVLTAPSPRNFVIEFPTGVNIKNAIQASVAALDTRNSNQTCAVSFTPAAGANSAFMSFSRGHNNSNQNTVSFATILELA